MNSGLNVFLSSLIFGVVVSISYWFSSYDPVGAILLGLMSVGFLMTTGYTALNKRTSDLAADQKAPAPESYAGERVGQFIVESPWPLVTAIGAAAVLIGITLEAWLASIGALVFTWGVVMLIRESG